MANCELCKLYLNAAPVLVQDGNSYRSHGIFLHGEQASSQLLSGFKVDVNVVFDAS